MDNANPAATRILRPGPCLALLLAISAPTAIADELIMKNGDRLSGDVVSRSGDALQFKTAYAGTLSISWSQIQEIRSEQTMLLKTDQDQVISSRHLVNQDQQLLIETVDGEPMTIDQVALSEINPEPWTLGNGYKFSGRINLAGKRERGNNHKDELDIDGNWVFRRTQHRYRSFFNLELDSKDGRSSKNKWLFRNSYDFFTNQAWQALLEVKKTYYGVTVAAEADQFADLTLRLGAGPHAGYQFYEGHNMNLLAEIGFMRIHEQFQNDSDQNYWAPAWLLDFDKFVLQDSIQLYHKQIGFRGVTGPKTLGLTSWTGLRIPLWAGFVASSEFEVEYDSNPATGADKTDYTTRLKLGYQW